MPLAIEGLARRFYADVWNRRSEEAAWEILHPELQFRGSLDAVREGQDGFIAYMHEVHEALENYTCTITDLIASGERAAARLDFRGRHRGPFFGVNATGKEIVWTGAAFFTERDSRIGAIWVLGDIDAVKKQLGIGQDTKFET